MGSCTEHSCGDGDRHYYIAPCVVGTSLGTGGAGRHGLDELDGLHGLDGLESTGSVRLLQAEYLVVTVEASLLHYLLGPTGCEV